ncbi:MAG TPA: hypothetical protein VIK69_00845 [Methylophilaceae bacterium]|jgi:hypothetical protein
MTLELRRRAIYTGLRPFLTDDELRHALVLWEREFSNKPKFALNVFIARCCDTEDLKEKRAEMLRAVIHAMDLPAEQLLPEPSELLLQDEGIKAEPGHELDHVTTVFVALLTAMLKKHDYSTQGGIRNFLVENLQKLRLEARNEQRLRAWLSGQSSQLTVNLGIEVLQKLVNLTYVAMCQYVGPVKADQQLAQALKEVEGEARAHKVNLSDFL